MKTLIFTAKYGNGHLQVTKLLKEIIDIEIESSEKSEPIVYEPMNKIFLPLDFIISFGYNKIFLPNSKNLLFRQSYDKACFIFGSRFNMFITRMILTPFVKFIMVKEKPEIIIQTFPFNSLYNPKIPNVVFITDYGVHNFWIDKKADHFFVATDWTKNQLIKKGIDKSKITISGIPIPDTFSNVNTSKSINKVLISFGANGIKFSKKYAKQLQTLLDKDLELTIICGRNQKLYDKLTNYFAEIKNINILGFTKEMDKHLKEHDLLVTKPGGITLTEAINSETPVIVNTQLSILGQEKFNIDFIKATTIGLLSTTNNLIKDIEMLSNDKELYNKMVQNMKDLKIPNQKDLINDIINNEIKKYYNTKEK